MCTGYHLRVGYCSGSSGEHDAYKNWQMLVQLVGEIRDQPGMIIKEVERVGDQDKHDGTLLWSAAEDMSTAAAEAGSQACMVIDDPPGGGRDREVLLMASGGKPGRAAKEAVRRAFCRVVIEEMHRRGIEVSLVVA